MDIRNVTPADRLPERKLVKSQQLNQFVDRFNRSLPLMHAGQADDVPILRGAWAKVTSSASEGGTYFHAWTEQIPTADGDWRDKPDGRSGTTSVNPLVSADGGQISDDTVVWAIPVTAGDGSPQYRAAPAGGIALQVEGDDVVAPASAINIPAESSGAITFEDNGDGTGDLKLSGGAAHKVLQYNGSAYVWDYVRLHG